jgi:hypothetical protein
MAKDGTIVGMDKESVAKEVLEHVCTTIEDTILMM